MPRKVSGGPRDAVLNVRIPAKLKFGLQLISRRYHEPIPDIIVRLIGDAFTDEHGGLMVDLPGEEMPCNLLERVWDERESSRFAKLAFLFTLLTLPQQVLWKGVVADDKYWQEAPAKGRKKGAAQGAARIESNFLWDELEADWEGIKDGAN